MEPDGTNMRDAHSVVHNKGLNEHTDDIPPDYHGHHHNLHNLVISRKLTFHTQGNNLVAFNRHTHELVQMYSRHALYITCVKYFDFKVYTAGQDGKIFAWSLKTGEPLYEYLGHEKPITCMDLKPRQADSQHLSMFTSCWGGKIRLWSINTDRLKAEFVVGRYPVETFVVYKGRLFAGSGNELKVFDTANFTLLYHFENTKERLYHNMKIMDDEPDVYPWEDPESYLDKPARKANVQLICGGNTVTVYDVKTLSNESEPLLCHEYKVDDVQFDIDEETKERVRRPTGKVNHIRLGNGRFWTGHDDGTLRCWDAETATFIEELEHRHTGAITCMYLYKEMLITGSTDHQVLVWNVDEDHESLKVNEFMSALKGHTAEITNCLKFRGLLYTASVDCNIRIWDLNGDLRYLGMYKGSAARVKAMTVSGDMLYAANSFGNLVVWDNKHARLHLEVQVSKKDPCRSVAVHDGFVYVAVGSQVLKFSIEGVKEAENKEYDEDLYLANPHVEKTIDVFDEVSDLLLVKKDLYVGTSTNVHRLDLTNGTVADTFRKDPRKQSFVEQRPGQRPVTRVCYGNIDGEKVIFEVNSGSDQLTVWKLDGTKLRDVELSAPGTAVAFSNFFAEQPVVYVGCGYLSPHEKTLHTIEVFRLPDFVHFKSLEFHTNGITQMLARGKFLMASSLDESVSVWKTENCEKFTVIRKHINAVSSIACNGDMDDDGTFPGWDGVLHSGSTEIISTELALYEHWGVMIHNEVGCGSGGLFGQPVEPEAKQMERERLERIRELKENSLLWHSGLWSSVTWVTCLFSWVLPCCASGMLKKLRDEDEASSESLRFCVGCMGCLAFPCFRAYDRSRTRFKYQIQGDFTEDCFTAMLCPCCSISQELSEVDFAHTRATKGPAMATVPLTARTVAKNARASNAHANEETYEGDPDKDVGEVPHDVREYDDQVQKKRKRISAFLDLFCMGYFVMIIEYFQILTFAFTVGAGTFGFDSGSITRLEWVNDSDSLWPDVSTFVDVLQGLVAFSPRDVNYDAKLAGSVLIVLLLWTLILAQEGLEWRRFLFPSNRFVDSSWRAVRVGVKLLVIVFAFPLMHVFGMAFSCEKVRIVNPGTGVDEDKWIWDADPGVECYTSVHLVRCGLAAIALAFYFFPALRLIRVGTELRKIEVLPNPFDWGHDVITHDYVAPTSIASPIPDVVTMLVKVALLAVNLSLPNHRDTQALANFFLVLMLALIQYMRVPFYSRRMSAVRMSATWTLVWFFGIALVAQLRDEQVTLESFAIFCLVAVMIIGPMAYLFSYKQLKSPSCECVAAPEPLNFKPDMRHQGMISIQSLITDTEAAFPAPDQRLNRAPSRLVKSMNSFKFQKPQPNFRAGSKHVRIPASGSYTVPKSSSSGDLAPESSSQMELAVVPNSSSA